MLNDLLELLNRSGVEDSEAVLDVLCAYVLGIDYSASRISRITGELSLSGEQNKELVSLVERRCKGEPLEYITGEREFYGFVFKCRRNVLIPRIDTEILVDTALEFVSDGDRILDLCTGTGCIGISISKMRKVETVLADISEDALECARENISLLCECGNVRAERHDVFRDEPDGSFDIITANPPYISSDGMKHLGADVLQEPELALFGGDDGLEYYRVIAGRYCRFINNGGRIFFETGFDQGEQVASILEKNGFTEIIIKKDYNNLDRVVYARKKV